MISIRKHLERGVSQLKWLSSFHTFSFADYRDLNFMGFSRLRVINEDTIQPGSGFGRHPHRDMEIITYVMDGSLEHQDSLGTGSIIKPGEIQRMSAGCGIEHSEFNHSKQDLLHLLQIWILPESKNLSPSYEQKTIAHASNQWILIGSRQGGEHAITIHQDVSLFVAYLDVNESIHYQFKKERCGWVQLVKGRIQLNGYDLSAGDGASMVNEATIHIQCLEPVELLLFDLSSK